MIESVINLLECPKISYAYVASRVLRSRSASKEFLLYGSRVTSGIVFR